MSTVIFWDLDGTLLTTNRGGVWALEDACESVLGERLDLQGMKTAGMTDREIASAIIRQQTGRNDAQLEAAFLNDYADALPARLEQRRGRMLPNVAEILEACREHEEIKLALLTGNIERGARTKLLSYGIDPYLFAFGGFAEDGRTRVEIGEAAVRRAGGTDSGTAAYVVGDTPSDIEAGRALGLRTVAVATGAFSLDELLACGPWAGLEQLPDPGAFLALVGFP